MDDERQNDWLRMKDALDDILHVVLQNTHGAIPCSDSVTMRSDAWITAVCQLERCRRQCQAYGKAEPMTEQWNLVEAKKKNAVMR